MCIKTSDSVCEFAHGSEFDLLYYDDLLPEEFEIEKESQFRYVTPLTVGEYLKYIKKRIVTAKNILPWLVLLTLKDLRIPMEVFDSEILTEVDEDGSVKKTPSQGSLFDQIPDRLSNTILRIFFEYLWVSERVLVASIGKFAHDNFNNKQKGHLLKVCKHILVTHT